MATFKLRAAVIHLRRRKLFLERRIRDREALGPLPPGDFDVQEVKALAVALACIDLCRSYHIVATMDDGQPLFKGQMKEKEVPDAG